MLFLLSKPLFWKSRKLWQTDRKIGPTYWVSSPETKRIIQNLENVDFENDCDDDQEYSHSIEEEQELRIEKNIPKKRKIVIVVTSPAKKQRRKGPQKFKCETCDTIFQGSLLFSVIWVINIDS